MDYARLQSFRTKLPLQDFIISLNVQTGAKNTVFTSSCFTDHVVLKTTRTCFSCLKDVTGTKHITFKTSESMFIILNAVYNKTYSLLSLQIYATNNHSGQNNRNLNTFQDKYDKENKDLLLWAKPKANIS